MKLEVAVEPKGRLGGYPHLGTLLLAALVCDGTITGWLGHG